MKVSLTVEGLAMLSGPKEEMTDPLEVLFANEYAQLRELLEKLLVDWDQRFPAERGRHHGHPRHKHHHGKERHHGKHE